MLTFLVENSGTIIMSVFLLAVVAGIVTKLVRDKRKGKCVGCDCGGCPSRTGKYGPSVGCKK